MQAPLQARNDSNCVQTKSAAAATQRRILVDNRPEAVSQQRGLVDCRPAAVAQRKMAEMLNNSPRMLQQRALSDAIYNIPRMALQCHAMNALFGGAVKPQGDGAMPAELSPGQRKEKPNNTGLPDKLKSGIESLSASPRSALAAGFQQMADNSPQATQLKQRAGVAGNTHVPVQRETKPNNTGLPDQLKSGVESISGISMDHVKVHYNSDKPAQLQAHAYAQGSEIHLAPGQERHLPHEAWHVVQQAQGRVRPLRQLKSSVLINDEAGLEMEAEMMGARAISLGAASSKAKGTAPSMVARPINPTSIQMKITFKGQKQFNDLEHLSNALKATYQVEHHEEIQRMIAEADASSWSIGAIATFKQIATFAKNNGWEGIVPASSSTRHGPQLPQWNSTHTGTNREYAMSSFMFSSVTMAHADLTLPDCQVIPFEARQKGPAAHAEDVLLEKIEAYIRANNIDVSKTKLRITINNLPCGAEHKDCAQTLADFEAGAGFKSFHLYYSNNYGKSDAAIKTLQSVGIQVSNFAPSQLNLDENEYKSTTFKKIQKSVAMAPAHTSLAPWSDTDDESDSDASSLSVANQSTGKQGNVSVNRESPVAASSSSVKDQIITSAAPTNKLTGPGIGKRKQNTSTDNMVELFGRSLDTEPLFENIPEQLTTPDPISLNGYQVGRLVEIFRQRPAGQDVNIAGVNLRIYRSTIPLPKTKYNPEGLHFFLARYFRGG